jgi:hypothetical protein
VSDARAPDHLPPAAALEMRRAHKLLQTLYPKVHPTPLRTLTMVHSQRDKMTQTSPCAGCADDATEIYSNCTTLSRIPTVTGNTVRSFYYARTTVRSQGSSTTVSRFCHHPNSA